MQAIICNKRPILSNEILNHCDRHLRLFGNGFQEIISTMNIGIVGAGGTGSNVIEQLKRLYPGKITIIDYDRVENTNLNRLTNSDQKDANENISKVKVAERSILKFNPEQDLEIIDGNILDKENQEIFKGCDFIFGAVDSIAPRFTLNQLCLANGIPYFDCGTGVIIEDKKLKHVGGQIIMILPESGSCLYCSGLFNRDEAMRELINPEEARRQQDMGYISGADIAAPQVYSLNLTVSSLGVWLFMRILSGERFDFDVVTLDAKNLILDCWKMKKEEALDCPICGKDGIIFKGDDADLLCRENNEDDLNINAMTSES